MTGKRISLTKPTRNAGTATLVPFREEGGKPPLFHVPIGSGDLRLFGIVAEKLDDRPVYGLGPPSRELVKDVRKRPMHWLMSEYIKLIKSVQPVGPYHLSGYSGGGLLAVELALSLIRAGESIAFLAMLDPPVRLPRWLNYFYVCVYELCNLTPTTDKIRWRIIRRSNNRLLRWTSDEGSRTLQAILAGHTIRSYPGSVFYIRPVKSWIRTLNLIQIGRTWRKIVKGDIEDHWTPGGHHTMLLRQNGEAVAAKLKECLRRTGNVSRRVQSSGSGR